MAGAAPTIDPSSLNAWEDAFQHPLPVVRRLEQQLRKTLDENREKLRALVGASYRDLLGTAHCIIDMDEQMTAVESHLADIGKRCNTRALDRAVDNALGLRRASEQPFADRYAALALTKIVQSALSVVARLVKKSGDALLAAKLLGLARLLHRSASECKAAPPTLEPLRRKLLAARKKLLSYIERALVRSSADKVGLAHTLGAYALVTSSTPKEVLRHFLQVRYERLAASLEAPSKEEILQMMEWYGQTVLDTRELFPRRFADSLAQLAKVPLMEDEQVRSVFELNLDIYGSWIPDDIRAFTPWVHHDQLAPSEAVDALASWTKQAHECVVHGLQACLREQVDANVILEIRQKVLSNYLSLNSRTRCESPTQAVLRLRSTFLERMESIIVEQSRLGSLSLKSVELSDPSQTPSPWSLASSQLTLSGGANGLRKAVTQMRHGRSSAVEAEINRIDQFLGRLQDLWELIGTMRTSKWDEEVDFDLDDFDDGEALQATLTKEDPDQLQRALRQATANAFKDIYREIGEAAEKTSNPAFMVRLLREINYRTRSFGQRLDVPIAELCEPDIATSLHRQIAARISQTSLDAFVKGLQPAVPVIVTLWDGTPPLPVQPSPAIFRALMGLHRAMADAGNDLWSSACVSEVKTLIGEKLLTELEDIDFEADKPQHESLQNGDADHAEEVGDEPRDSSANGDGDEQQDNTPNGDVDEQQESAAQGPIDKTSGKENARLRRLGCLFDLLYMQSALSTDKTSAVRPLESLVSRLHKESELDGPANDRIRKNAHDYWARTYLLFGLLACNRN